jgi:hypothetical protein
MANAQVVTVLPAILAVDNPSVLSSQRVKVVSSLLTLLFCAD